MSQTETRRVNIYINAEEAQRQQEKLAEKSARLKAQIDELTHGTEAYQKRLDKFKNAETALKKLEAEAEELKKQMDGLNQESQEYIDKSKQLNKLYIEIDKTAGAVKRLKIDTAELAQKQAELAKTSEQYDRLGDRISGKVAPTMRELRETVIRLRRELEGIPTDTQEFIDKTKQLQQVSTTLRNIETVVKDTRTAWQKLKGDFKEFGSVVAGTVAGEIITGAWTAFSGFIASVTKNAAELSDQFADIAKTTGMTTKEVEKFNSELSKIDTRTGSKELREIAKVGGQLGIAREQLLGFTESVNMATVALGDEFTGGAEEVARELGILQKLFKETKDLNAGEAIERIGSAVNALGSAGSSTAPEVAKFTQRLGTLGNLGPNIAQTLGLGAAMQELGLSAEIASGGLTSIFLTAGNEAKAFAAQIGISEQAFKDLLNSDPNEMLMQLARSFQGLDNSQVVDALSRMKIGSQEAIKVMNLLASKTDFVREKQALAASEMEKNTSLRNEATLKENNFAGQLAKTEKIINGFMMAISQGLLPVMTSLLASFVSLIEVIKATPKFIRENQQWFIALGVAILTFNRAAIIANAQMLLMNARIALVTSVTKGWTIAQRLLNLAFAANPIGLVVTAISLLVAGIITAYQNSEQFRNTLNGVWEVMKELATATANFIDGLVNFNPAKAFAAFQNLGKKLGEAYSKGFNKERDDFLKKEFEGNEQKIRQQQADKILAWRKKQGEQLADAQREAIEKENKARAAALAKGDDKEAKKRAEELKKKQEEYEEAQRNINRLQIAAMEEGLAKRLAQIDFDTQEEIQKLKGSAEQIAAQRALIEAAAQKEKKKIIFQTTTQGVIQQAGEQEEIDFEREQKAIEARYKYRTEVEKQAAMKARLEIEANETASLAEKEGRLAALEQQNQAAALQSEQGYLLSRMELFRQFGWEYTTEYQALESKLLETQIASNALKLEEEKKVHDAKISMFQSFSGAFGDIQSGINQMGAEGTVFSKALAAAQIAIDTAISISKGIAGATAAAAAGGPAAPFLLAGYIASMVGSIVSAVGGASKLLKSANVPSPPSASKEIKGGYQGGGFTERASSDSKPVGVVHANEYVVPAPLLRSNPLVANFARITEGIRTGRATGFQNGGFASAQPSNPSSQANTNADIKLQSPELLQEIRNLRQDVQALRNMVFRGYVVYKDLKEVENIMTDLDNQITL